jgi:hypothetical protein
LIEILFVPADTLVVHRESRAAVETISESTVAASGVPSAGASSGMRSTAKLFDCVNDKYCATAIA